MHDQSAGRPGHRRRSLPALGAALVAVMTVALVTLGLVAPSAQAAGHRIALRVLVVTNGDPGTTALQSELDRQGIPNTVVNVGSSTRPTIDAAFLEDTASGTAKYQGVILPNETGGGLTADELTALATYEATYGVRQVDAYTFPGAAVGGTNPAFTGTLDGSTATVTTTGLAGPFRYLNGPVTIEDIDPTVNETFGYLAVSNGAAGQTFTSLVDATVGDATGSIAYVWGHDGREELVIAAGFNSSMQWLNVLAEGIVSWMTRGIHLGYNRNNLNVHIDDVFLPDSRWSVSGNCTPGDNCVDPGVTTTDIRMTPSDVTRLVNWQTSSGVKLDMVFNGGGSEAAKTESGNNSDPLTDAFLAAKSNFRWINHTYTHPFLGCIQIAPTVIGGSWHCMTDPNETPRMDPEVTPATGSDGVYYAAQDVITDQVQQNITWAQTNTLPSFDATELVTGEHSGLLTLPQQPNDNPFFAPALGGLGIRYTASDASREPNSRTLSGGETSTVPRHPMNIFYNAGTFLDEVDEYNWIYTSAANGGSDICTQNPQTTTCITPLAAGNNAEARTSFDNYIKPIEIRNALRFILGNDPRPFYAHQSNLAEDGILYPVLDGIVSTYNSTFNTSTTPLVQSGLTGQFQALDRLSRWTAASRASGYSDGWIDATGVHLPATTAAVPLTVPAESAGTGLDAYGGALSGWLGGSATVVPPTNAGGYTLGVAPTVPSAPTNVTAVAGSTVATVSWTPPGDNGGSPITAYVVRIYVGTSATPSLSQTAAGDATSLTVTGLTNGTSYRFDVAAINTVGTGPASPLTAAVTPRNALAPLPSAVTPQVGNASAMVTWTPPANLVGVTGYRIRAYLGTSTNVVRLTTVPVGQTVAAIAGLTNGTGYTFTVNVQSSAGNGQDSERSTLVTPTLSSQTDVAPAVTGIVPGQGTITVTWSPPAELAGTTPTGYRVAVYQAGTTTLVKRNTTTADARTFTVTGLTNGVSYDVQVNVQAAAGNGPTSARSAAVVPQATVPTAPVIGSASSGSAGGAITAVARWTPPTSNGGSPILGYVVTATRYEGEIPRESTSSALLSSGSRSFTMTLPVVGSYRFTVVARNAMGDSPSSAASNLVTGQ